MIDWWEGLNDAQQWGLFMLFSMTFIVAVWIAIWPDKMGHDD